jgi:hypothetical protein
LGHNKDKSLFVYKQGIYVEILRAYCKGFGVVLTTWQQNRRYVVVRIFAGHAKSAYQIIAVFPWRYVPAACMLRMHAVVCAGVAGVRNGERFADAKTAGVCCRYR